MFGDPQDVKTMIRKSEDQHLLADPEVLSQQGAHAFAGKAHLSDLPKMLGVGSVSDRPGQLRDGAKRREERELERELEVGPRVRQTDHHATLRDPSQLGHRARYLGPGKVLQDLE